MIPIHPRSTGRPLAVITLATLAMLFGPLMGLAGAHVTVTSPGATQGEEGALSFRVPTEKETPTVKLEVALPTDAPITDVLVKAKAGWSVALTKAPPAEPVTGEDGQPVTEVVTRITWSATAGGIAPDQYDTFEVLADPLPKVSTLEFKALQTYQDGSVVSWIQEQAAGAPEPDYPAPMLHLAADSTGTDSTGTTASDTATTAAASSTSSSAATVLAVIALVVAVISLIGVATVLLRRTHAR